VVLTTNKKKSVIGNITPEKYGSRYNDHLFEQYKLYVETTDKVSDRRAIANTFFITVVSAMISIMGVLIGFGNNNKFLISCWMIIISLSGIIICYSWYVILQSYRQLNYGKFKIISEIEEKLPLQCYDSEWNVLGKGKQPKLYRSLTTIEKRVPIMFILIFIAMIIGLFIWIIIGLL